MMAGRLYDSKEVARVCREVSATVMRLVSLFESQIFID